MRVFALLSWFDEDPMHLRRCVLSLRDFVDVLVAVDGPYATFPGARGASPPVQRWAVSDATRAAGLRPYLVTSDRPWPSEVEKRAAMFEYARMAGAHSDDWLLVIDADEALSDITSDTRAWLEDTDRDVAEVRYQRVQINGVVCATASERRLYRALPGLTVERAHFLYHVPDEGQPLGRRFLWRKPDGHLADVPTLDLSSHVTMQHYNSQREPDRKQRALDYYRARDAAGLEAVGDWR